MDKDRLLGKKTLNVGGFLDEFEKDDIKKQVDIKTLFEYFGAKPVKKGNNWVARCIFGRHEDKTPSLFIDSNKGLYNCFGCGYAGDHFTLVMIMKECGFKEALQFLKEMAGKGRVRSSRTIAKKKETGPGTGLDQEASPGDQVTGEDESPPGAASPEEQATETVTADISLDEVCNYYHKKLYENKNAYVYLIKTRKINPELIRRFKIGYAEGSLLKIISNGQKETCVTMGILKTADKSRVREFFTGCITFPVTDESGKTVHFYGRKADPGAKQAHLYLPGSHKSVFNRKASRVYDSIIIVESIIDSLSLMTMGIENVQSLYGVGTFTGEHLRILKDDRVKTVVLAFDNDDAGMAGSDKHKTTLLEAGFSVKVITPPSGKDWNDSLLAGIKKEEIEQLIRQAPLEYPEKKTRDIQATRKGGKYIFSMEDITYCVLGAKKMFATSLRVNIKAEYRGMRFPDNVDLCSARSRTAYSQTLARMFELETRRIENDLLCLVDYFDREREKESTLDDGTEEAIELTDQEKAEGLGLLKDLHMFDRIAEDMTALGYVNEEINKLIVYIAAMSRFMKKPLSVYIQSGSSGGKSALLSTLEQLILPQDIWKATTISAQAFNYVEQKRFLGKVFFMGESIHDESIEGLVRQMQSEGEISRLVTVKDEKTGEMNARLISKQVRMSFMVTSTALHLNGENASRCLILTADESKTQTHRVQERLGKNHDLTGVMMRPVEAEKIIRKHYAAQMQLRQVSVYNPYCKHINFPTARPSMRRAYEQFLTMIDTICFLRQMQKPDELKVNPATREEVVCKACDLEDYRIAYELFTRGIIQNSGFDIPTGTRKLYEVIREMVRDQAEKQQLKVNEVSFIQKSLREYTQLGGEFIKKHIRILTNYEYLEVLGGRRYGTRYAYRLREDRPVEEIDTGMITTPEELKRLIKK